MRTSSSDDNKYPRFCDLASSDDTVFSAFKSSSIYNEILEHVTKEASSSASLSPRRGISTW